jgi:hypothetical protein
MIRLAVVLLLAVGVSAVAEDKPVGPAIVEVKLDAGDKPGVKTGEWAKPSKVTSAEELEKLIADKATREKIAKAVDLKTHDLLVFAWQGSGRGQDRVCRPAKLPGADRVQPEVGSDGRPAVAHEAVRRAEERPVVGEVIAGVVEPIFASLPRRALVGDEWEGKRP